MSNQFNESTDSVKSKGVLDDLGKVFEVVKEEMSKKQSMEATLLYGYELWVGDNNLGLPQTDYIQMCFYEDMLCFGVKKLKLSGSEITDTVSIPLSRIVSVEDVENHKAGAGKIIAGSILAAILFTTPVSAITGVALCGVGLSASVSGIKDQFKTMKSGYFIFYLDEENTLQSIEIKKSVFTGKKFHDFSHYLNENMKLIERDEKVLELIRSVETENNKSIEEDLDTLEEKEEALEELEEELAELEEEISKIQFTDDPKYITLNKKIEEIEKAIKQAKAE